MGRIKGFLRSKAAYAFGVGVGAGVLLGAILPELHGKAVELIAKVKAKGAAEKSGGEEGVQ